MSEFDPVKAQREILMGLRDAYGILQRQANAAQGRLAQAEVEANALMKVERMAREYLKVEEAKLNLLLEEHERAAQG
jgi:hypothetical protein